MPVIMLLFLDESGDPGFKFKSGSSRYFVVVLVIFANSADAEGVGKAIRSLRPKLGLRENYEFRFSTGSSDRVKSAFFEAVASLPFNYRAAVIDKIALWQDSGQAGAGQLYSFVFDALFNRDEIIHDATLTADKVSGGEFAREFDREVRRRLNEGGLRRIRRFKHSDSRRNDLLQLADMICGAVYRGFAKGDAPYWHLIRQRQIGLEVWKPKKKSV